MSREPRDHDSTGNETSISQKAYKELLRELQVERVKLQRHFIQCDDKILTILEGRDAATKAGS